MLYTLNLHSAVCQLNHNKTGPKKKKKEPEETFKMVEE